MADLVVWRKPKKCNDFILKLNDKQQCPSAVFYLSMYIKRYKYEEKPFDGFIETDIQSHNSNIKHYLEQSISNKQVTNAIFINICALVESAPIADHRFNMIAMQLTRITFHEFSMKERQNCMKYIIVDVSFDTGIYGLYEDLLEYNEKQNLSIVMDYLLESKNTKECQKWLLFLKRAIKEHAYHATEIDDLETYLLQQPATNLNTFEQFCNDLYTSNITTKQQRKKPNISNNEAFTNEICCIQNNEFRRLFIDRSHTLSEFEAANRIQSTQYIVTKYANPQEAKQDRKSLIQNLMCLTLGDMNSMYNAIFDNEYQTSTDDDAKQEQKLFEVEQECIQFVNTLFHTNNKSVLLPYIETQQWTEKECKQLLTLCNGIIGKEVDDKWVPNSVLMHSKLHPNITFNLSVIDARDAVFWTINNTQTKMNTHKFAKKFQEYLQQQKLQHLISEEDFKKLSALDGPSAFVTNRFLPYIPVLVALLNDDFKSNGCCKMTQTAIAQASFRISDIMNAFKLKDYDQIIHVDLVILYKSKMMDELQKTHDVKSFECDEKEDFYAMLFDTIALEYIAKLEDAKHCVIRIFLHFEGEKPHTLVELCELNMSTKHDIEKKINHRKDPIYLPHVLYAFDRYQNLFINNGDDEKHSDELTHLQYSLIIFPQIMSDNETIIYINKQILCVREGVLPFNRSDINELVPMMFQQNEQKITKEYIANMEKEYGNIKNRKRFFYDKPLEKLAQQIEAK